MTEKKNISAYVDVELIEIMESRNLVISQTTNKALREYLLGDKPTNEIKKQIERLQKDLERIEKEREEKNQDLEKLKKRLETKRQKKQERRNQEKQQYNKLIERAVKRHKDYSSEFDIEERNHRTEIFLNHIYKATKREVDKEQIVEDIKSRLNGEN